MPATQSGKASQRLVIISEPQERILRAIHHYRYMTAMDATHLLYKPSVLTYVREMLSRLAGGEDFKTGQYLYRFRLPSAAPNSERVYTLGSRGRNYLADEVGLPVEWYFRPEKVKHMGYGQVVHNLILTRFLVAAYKWSANHPEYRLAKTRTSYELARYPVPVRVSGWEKMETVPVIPDAWLLFERLEDGVRKRVFPVLLEIDRGTAHQQKFKQHVAARIEYVGSGAYEKIFGYKSVIIAYATTGARPEYRETRLAAMRTWTSEVLTKLRMENWVSMFRFHSLALNDIYAAKLFEEPVWFRPHAAEPVRLIAD